MIKKIGKDRIRTIAIGGFSKEQLLAHLKEVHVLLNDAAKTLFASELFTTSSIRQNLSTIEIAVVELGFPHGAKMPEIHARALEVGLRLPPLELGPHMRLQYKDQPEGHIGHPVTKHRAPPGSLNIASAPVCKDHEFPKGFYLRRIENVLWLRGYREDLEHLYDAEDRFIFCLE